MGGETLNIPGLSPYAFHLGPIGVHWYGIFMVTAMLIGIYLMTKEGVKHGLDGDFVANAALSAILGGVVGARLFFVIFNYPQWFWQDPLQTLRVWQGGLSYHGGLVGGLLGAWLYVHYNRKPDSSPKTLSLLADLAVPGLNIGYIGVRIGNIFNHEVLGRHAAILPGDARWPAQLVGVAIGLFLIWRHYSAAKGHSSERHPGYLFWSFVTWYSVLRGFIEESVRDNPLYLIHYVNPFWGIGLTTMTQLFTPAILALSVYMTRRSLRLGEGQWGKGDLKIRKPVFKAKN